MIKCDSSIFAARGVSSLEGLMLLACRGIPEVIEAGTCAFEPLEGAVRPVIEAIQKGLPVAHIELLDVHQICASNAYSGLALAEMPTLVLEFDGSDGAVAEQVALFASITSGDGGGALISAAS